MTEPVHPLWRYGTDAERERIIEYIEACKERFT